MRWDRLFADLEGQLDAAQDAELQAEVAERLRHETGAQTLVDRLRAAVGCRLGLGLAGGLTLRAELIDVGPDWLLADDGRGQLLVPGAAVCWLEDLPARVGPAPSGTVWGRLDLRRALRGLARQRAVVAPVLRDGSRLTGTLDRVYADHVDLALHPADEPRRPGAVTSVRSIPLGALAVVRQLG